MLIACSIIGLCSCKKDKTGEPNPPVSEVPAITLNSLTPGTVKQFKDELKFNISYLDGDGDLGYSDADSFAVFITDQRFPVTIKYHISPVAPEGANISVQGNWVVTLKNIILKDQNSASESATFTILVRDRAGHSSNTITTASITIVP